MGLFNPHPFKFIIGIGDLGDLGEMTLATSKKNADKCDSDYASGRHVKRCWTPIARTWSQFQQVQGKRCSFSITSGTKEFGKITRTWGRTWGEGLLLGTAVTVSIKLLSLTMHHGQQEIEFGMNMVGGPQVLSPSCKWGTDVKIFTPFEESLNSSMVIGVIG